MPESLQDKPNVIFFPPIILSTTIALGLLFQWWLPLGALATISQIWRIPVAFSVLLIGVLLAATGRRALMRLGTNVSPLLPTTALATEGIFGWTRNPLYSGGTLVMLGIALVFALDWLLVLILPSLLILHFGVVRREEQYLERKFGDRYRLYKLHVPRYGLGI
ncbi:MAG: methyltransferase family protein [Sphingobacteriales bacterium]|jgi:protein-S-isoprenylcysteine O-methyltransferase Ste14